LYSENKEITKRRKHSFRYFIDEFDDSGKLLPVAENASEFTGIKKIPRYTLFL